MQKQKYYIPKRINTASGMDPKVEKLSSPTTVKERKAICEKCPNKTKSGFCSVNKEFIAEFVKWKTSSCPKEIWLDTFSVNRKR